MRKFNLKKGVKNVKSQAKKLPKRTAKQLPNAAMFVSGGVSGMAVKGGMMAAKKKAARKVAKKATSSFKLPGQKRKVKVFRRDS